MHTLPEPQAFHFVTVGWEGGAEPSCMHERAFKRPRIQMDGIGESDIEEI